MIEEIGLTAGAIWRHLESCGPISAQKLKKNLDLKDATLWMALGWLAREGKLAFEGTGWNGLISLAP